MTKRILTYDTTLCESHRPGSWTVLHSEQGEQEWRLLDDKVRGTGGDQSYNLVVGEGLVVTLSDMGSTGKFWAEKKNDLIYVLKRSVWKSWVNVLLEEWGRRSNEQTFVMLYVQCYMAIYGVESQGNFIEAS